MRRHPLLQRTLLELMRQHISTAAVKLEQLRRRALIPALIVQTLSCLPVADRLRAGLVCREWRGAVQHPSLWRDGGWWCTRYVDRPDAMPLPPWLRARLLFLHCSMDWLVQGGPLSCLQSFSQLRHLELRGRLGTEVAVSAAALHRALGPLPLQTLILPHSGILPSVLPPPLVAALTQPSEQGQPPLLMTWAASLTRLTCEFSIGEHAALLSVLSSCAWPLLRRLAVRFSCCEDEPSAADIATVMRNLRQWLSPQVVPALTALSYNTEGCHGYDCACVALDWPPLAGLRALTELDLSWSVERSALDFFRLLSADAMPLLRRLAVYGYREWIAAAGSEELGAIALLQRMPLTALRLADDVSIGPLLHYLPQLRELCCCNDMDESTVAAIAAASQLLTFEVLGRTMELLLLLQHWWRRMGCPALETNGCVDEGDWEDHLDEQESEQLQGSASAAPLLRELIVSDDILPGVAFPYLAHLPHLRVLECKLRMTELAALGLLPQLEELRLRPAWTPQRGVEQWIDAGLRTLGGLPLLRLHTLRLFNTDERWSECSVYDEGISGDDPDFPWGEPNNHERLRCRAVVQTDVTLDGLRALLQLPALIALDLPWIEESTVEQFRQHAKQPGRTALRINRPVPLSRRSLLERHWLSVAQLAQSASGEPQGCCPLWLSCRRVSNSGREVVSTLQLIDGVSVFCAATAALPARSAPSRRAASPAADLCSAQSSAPLCIA